MHLQVWTARAKVPSETHSDTDIVGGTDDEKAEDVGPKLSSGEWDRGRYPTRPHTQVVSLLVLYASGNEPTTKHPSSSFGAVPRSPTGCIEESSGKSPCLRNSPGPVEVVAEVVAKPSKPVQSFNG